MPQDGTRSWSLASLAVVLALVGLAFGQQPEAASGRRGVAINYPGIEDGLHFSQPSRTWDEAIPLGNGIMGALVWGDGKPLRISLDRADLWDLRPVPEFSGAEYDFQTMRRWHQEGRVQDLLRVYEDPYNRPAPTRIPAGRIELGLGDASFLQGRLDPLGAVGELHFRPAVRVQVIVHALQPLGLIRIAGANNLMPRLVAPEFAGNVRNRASGGIAAGDLAQLGYAAPTPSEGETWQAFLQEGAEGFQFAIFLGWRKNSDQSWIAAWSIASTLEGPDPLARARGRVETALGEGFEKLSASHRDWWRAFWEQSSIRLPNPVLERLWFLEMYKFGSAARRGAPPITLQAIWTADNGGLPPWKGDYHHDLNTELSYWPAYASNHLEEGLGFLDWLWETRKAGFEWTRAFFKMPGLNVPMTADLLGRQIGGWRQYTHSATTAAWLSHHFYLHWAYSRDREFLQSRAYPYLKDSCIFLEAYTKEKDPSGKRTFPLSASPEINDNRPEAWFSEPTNYDVALARWLFGAASELAGELGLNKDRDRWQRILRELPELAVGKEGLLVALGYPLRESHRHFSHLMAIHPLGLLDWDKGADQRAVIDASMRHLAQLGSDWWTGYSFAWQANLNARMRAGEDAVEALEIFARAFTLPSSFHCNGDQSGQGYSRLTYRPFTLEGNFAAAAGILEMLLQSHNGLVRVFPAIPAAWTDVEFTSLRAEGGLRISASKEGGGEYRIEVLAEAGGPVVLVVPDRAEPLRLVLKRGEQRVLTFPE